MPQSGPSGLTAGCGTEYLAETLASGHFLAYVADVAGQMVSCGGMVFFDRPPHPAHLSGQGSVHREHVHGVRMAGEEAGHSSPWGFKILHLVDGIALTRGYSGDNIRLRPRVREDLRAGARCGLHFVFGGHSLARELH